MTEFNKEQLSRIAQFLVKSDYTTFHFNEVVYYKNVNVDIQDEDIDETKTLTEHLISGSYFSCKKEELKEVFSHANCCGESYSKNNINKLYHHILSNH